MNGNYRARNFFFFGFYLSFKIISYLRTNVTIIKVLQIIGLQMMIEVLVSTYLLTFSFNCNLFFCKKNTTHHVITTCTYLSCLSNPFLQCSCNYYYNICNVLIVIVDKILTPELSHDVKVDESCDNLIMTDAAIASRWIPNKQVTTRDYSYHRPRQRRRGWLWARRHFVRANSDAEEQRIVSSECDLLNFWKWRMLSMIMSVLNIGVAQYLLACWIQAT